MSWIERKYCLISASYLAGLFDIVIIYIDTIVCIGDAYHKEFGSVYWRSVLDISDKAAFLNFSRVVWTLSKTFNPTLL